MNSVCNEQILADMLSKLNSTQQCIETLSHWCIFHRSKAEQLATTWDKQFYSSDMVHKVHLLYLANDILQNSKRKGNEFVTEFWKVLPSALKEIASKGDECTNNVVSRLVCIWEERKVFGSRAQSLKEVMLGDGLPPPLEFKKKRSRSVRLLKKDSRSIRTKLTVGGTAEKIVSAFHSVISENTNEDEEMSKCKSAVHRVKKMEKDVEVALTKAKDPSRKSLSKELEVEENNLKQCIEKLKVVESNRVELVSQLRDDLREQESELEVLRTQVQVALAQVEEASKMRRHLDDQDRVFDPKPLTPSITDANGKTDKTSLKYPADIVADKLTASTSSQYIMTSVLSSFAEQEAQGTGMTLTISNPENPVFVSPAQSNSFTYQTQIPCSQSQYDYQTIPSNNPSNSLQYMQHIPGPYDYSGGLMPPQPGPPSYMVSQMGQQSQQMGQQSQQMGQLQMLQMGQQGAGPGPGPAGFWPMAPVQAPESGNGMVYYMHPYRSQ